MTDPATIAPCSVCGSPTQWACSDCAINSGGRRSVHVCPRPECRRDHERTAKCAPAGNRLGTPAAGTVDP